MVVIFIIGYYIGAGTKNINEISTNRTNQSIENVSNKSLIEKIIDYVVVKENNKSSCGNGICESNEGNVAKQNGGSDNYVYCPQDCPENVKSSPVCGNGKCESGETKYCEPSLQDCTGLVSCPQDCGR